MKYSISRALRESILRVSERQNNAPRKDRAGPLDGTLTSEPAYLRRHACVPECDHESDRETSSDFKFYAVSPEDVKEAVGGKRAIVVMGGPGSGKSHVVDNFVVPALRNALVSDSDKHFEPLLRQHNIPTNPLDIENPHVKALRAAARELSAAELDQHLRTGRPVIAVGLGNNVAKTRDLHERLASAGYKVRGIYIHSSMHDAVTGNANRARQLPTDFIRSSHAEVEEAYGGHRQTFGSHLHEINNYHWHDREIDPAYHKSDSPERMAEIVKKAVA